MRWLFSPLIRELVALIGFFLLSYFLFGVVQYSVLGRIDMPYMALKPSHYVVNTAMLMTPLLAFSIIIETPWLLVGAILTTALFGVANQLKISQLNEPILIFDIYKLQLSSIFVRYFGVREATLLSAATIASIAGWKWTPWRGRGSRTGASRRAHPLRLATTCALADQYQLLCYDRLFGDKHSEELDRVARKSQGS